MFAAETNRITTHYACTDGARPPIVFVNSLGTDFRVWEPMLPHVHEGHRILRYDKRGHGLTEMTPSGFTIDDLADDLAALMEHQKLGDAVICGLSIGGLIAQSLASRRPDLVKSLILMDTGHVIGTKEMWRDRLDQVARSGIQSIADGILERWFTADFRANRTRELALWRTMLVRTSAEGYIGCGTAIMNADYTEPTSKLRKPCLCLVGDQDGSTPPDLVRTLAGLIADAEFTIIDGSGHLPCIEQPQKTAALINDFITRH